MKRAAILLLAMVLAGEGHGQSAGAPAPTALTCGPLKAESSRNSSTWQWTISTPSGKITETGTLRGGPRFECLDGTILVVEFTSSAGHSFFEAHFVDGTSVGYGRQQIDRRGSRIVLPVQAKARIAAPYRAAFDYHCRLAMPADPISATARADCIF